MTTAALRRTGHYCLAIFDSFNPPPHYPYITNLHALLPADSDPDVRPLDHRHVVGAVSDRESACFGFRLSNQSNHLHRKGWGVCVCRGGT